MDIHKPKPWRGIRELLKEIGTIVIGVLIALAAEQGVEWLHWRHQAQVARAAVAFDLRRLVVWAATRDTEAPCVAQRLGELVDAMNEAQTTKRLPAVGWSGAPTLFSWHMRSWSGLIAGQTLAHIPNREQLLLTGVSNYLESLRGVRTAESEEWATLRTMGGPGRPTSDAEIANLRAAAGRAWENAYYTRQVSRQLEAVIAASGFLDRKELDAAFHEGVTSGAQSFRATLTPRVCRPPAPATTSRDLFGRELLGPALPPGQGSPAEAAQSTSK